MSLKGIKDLPAPPIGKQGWPWTEEGPPLPPTLPDGQPWPRVSITTPSYNQGRFLEETIRSVLLQAYPNLEYHILDGGSTDGSIEVIRKYAPFLTSWESKRDGGPEFAVNKGWGRSTGSIVAFLPSDDFYLNGAVASSAEALHRHVEAGFSFGDSTVVGADGSYFCDHSCGGRFDLTRLLHHYYFHAPTVFIRKKVLDQVGYTDPNLRFLSDWDLWLRLAMVAPGVHVPRRLARMRAWEGSKTAYGPTYSHYERTVVLKKMMKRRLFRRSLIPEVRRALANHYWNWGGALVADRSWAQVPRAYVQAFVYSPRLTVRRTLTGVCGETCAFVKSPRAVLRRCVTLLPSGVLQVLVQVKHYLGFKRRFP